MIIASFPRSGNHWVRYIIEQIYKRPTLGEGDDDWKFNIDGPILERIYHSKECFKDLTPIAEKRHNIRQEDNNKKLLFILRDFKKSVIIQGLTMYSLDDLFNSNHIYDLMEMYYNLIVKFDIWEKNKKTLIYYIDLLNHPRDIINKIISFIGVNDEIIQNKIDFMNNYEAHRKNCLSIYENVRVKFPEGINITDEQLTLMEKWFFNKINKEKLEIYLKKFLFNPNIKE
jgi:hypothetical protein